MTKTMKILGPPGTGKTTKLLDIVAREMKDGVPPEKIAYVSFTRKAAKEAVVRAMDKFGFAAADFPYFRTLHSLCFRSNGVAPGMVFDQKKMAEFGEWVGVKITGKIDMLEGSFGHEVGDRCVFAINMARLLQVPLREHYLANYDDIEWEVMERVARGMDEFKQHHTLLDYTDMILKFLSDDWQPDLEVVIVDEAQDLSPVQWTMVEKLCGPAQRVYVAGDDDQAIYTWAGADVNAFINLPGEEIVLDQSWRVPRAVQKVADEIVGRIKNRIPKKWAARDVEGEVIKVSRLEDADYLGDDVLVLARNHFLFVGVVDYLRRKGIPYLINGYPAVKATTRDAIVAWESLRKGNTVLGEDVKGIYKLMSLNVGVARGFKTCQHLAPDHTVTLGDLKESYGLLTDAGWKEALDLISERERVFIDTVVAAGRNFKDEPAVKLSTIHATKGGQADHVIVLQDMTKRTFAMAQQDRDSEHRVWYVAVTRAKEKLTIVGPRMNNHYAI